MSKSFRQQKQISLNQQWFHLPRRVRKLIWYERPSPLCFQDESFKARFAKLLDQWNPSAEPTVPLPDNL